MSRLRQAFDSTRDDGRAALVAFLAAGDPDPETTLALARAARDGGADVLELGVPFSDPLADGPIIQSAYIRALAAGATTGHTLELAAAVADETGLPVVLMTSLNPVLARGVTRFCREAGAAGAAGVLVPDLLPEDADELCDAAAASELATVFLAAPDSRDERIARAAARSTGFLYLVSRAGVTGTQQGPGEALAEQVARARALAGDLPLAVGFGVRSREDAARVARLADGVIAGSALVAAAAGALEQRGRDAAAAAVRAVCEELRAGIADAAGRALAGG